MHKAYKFRLYPTESQKEFLSRQFGAVRFVYNFFLANRKDEYVNNKKSLNYYDDAKSLTILKQQDGYKWLNDINSQTLQSSLRNLESSYQNFFKKINSFPRFHSKKNKQSIKIPQHFKVVNNKLHIPKLKSGIKINLHQDLPEKQICCFISKTPTDKYYVSFLCEVDIKPLEVNSKSIGIDLGIKSLVTISNGYQIDNQKLYRKSEKKLIYHQRQLSKKKNGSNNKNKQRKILTKVHEKIANKRNDYLHKISKQLVNDNQVIIAESLSVKNMMSNHKLAKSIADCSWGELLRQLEYKSKWYGRTFYQIDKFFPSSKTCSNCQFVANELPLNIREWICPSCNCKHDRDINAAKNILSQGLKDLSGCGMQSDIKQKLVEAPAKLGQRNKKLLIL